MEGKYNDIYNILKRISKLSKIRYDALILKYGIDLVSKVIDDMVMEDDKNILKFEEYFADGLFCDSKDMDSYGYYLKDLNNIEQLSREDTKKIASEIVIIMDKINNIFKLITDEEIKFKRSPNNGFTGKYINSIVDKVEYYLSICSDDDLCNELKNLCNEFFIRRDKLVLSNLKFVIYLVRPYARVDIPFVDLVQVGNLGLMRAVETYDPVKYDILFTTYAYYWIKNCTLRAIKNMIYSVDFSHRIVMRKYHRDVIYNKLSFQFGREPSVSEIAECMKLSFDEVAELNDTYVIPYSIHNEIFTGLENDDFVTGSLLFNDVVDSSVNIEDDYIMSESLCEIKDILYSGNLSKAQFNTLVYRLGFVDGIKHTLQETGDYLGITKEAVRQNENRGIAKIRKLWE